MKIARTFALADAAAAQRFLEQNQFNKQPRGKTMGNRKLENSY
ncbi:hypothetical protein [uncultured Nitrosomonas sp.]|nr:hypothetical protein [uncultured Nitrosomonas sp.]